MPSSTNIKYTSLTQTFKVSTPEGVPGIFVSKMGLFFKAKSDSLGVELFLVRLTNGLPDPNKAIPGSTVIVDPEDISVSTDGLTETLFTFKQLVYLDAAESYGFVVKPIGNSPDYEIWVGELGKRDIADDKPIGSNPLVGTAFFSGNEEKYADLVNQDIKFKLYRAKFETTSGTASLRNKNIEILKLYNFSSILGEFDVRSGDQVFGWSNNFVNTSISATVQNIDLVNNLLYLKNSSANFAANTDIAFIRTADESQPTGNNSGILALARIHNTANNGIYKFPIHAIAPKLGIRKPPLTSVSLNIKGAVYNGTKYVQDNGVVIENNTEIEYKDQSRYLLGETDEQSAGNDFRTGTPSTNSSITIQATLSSNSNFISPVINLNGKNSLVAIRNIINNSLTNEHTNAGNAAAKYVSKIITLEDEMEAEDLKIYVTANKPANTEIYVYTKIWNAADPQKFDDKVWSKMVLEDPNKARNTNAPDEYLEYVYSFANTATLAGNAFAAYQTNDATPVIYYAANSTGGVSGGPSYGGSGYDRVIKKFAVKLVMTSDSGKEYLYPKLNDLRVIAVQV